MVKQAIGWSVLCLVILTGAAWAIEGSDFALYRVFAPKREAVRREIFEQSKAYNQGVAQELEAAEMDYAKASPDQKAAIRAVVLHRVADYDQAKLTPDLRSFVDDLRNGTVTP